MSVLHGLFQVATWVFGVAAAIALYELLRASLLRRLHLRFQRRVHGFLSENRPRLDRFKFVRKHYIREALLDDPDLGAYALRRAREPGGPGLRTLRRRIEEYAEEIVPYFDLVSYYHLGQGLARPLIRALYDVPYKKSAAGAAARAAPPGGAVVYVANHRSNADYILLSVVLARQVALSYAIGEWARVWPLETLFKSFGGYFVRRGEKDPLYHRVLRRYVQLIVREGVTQGIFLEGGLSRDGDFRPAKAGLLDAIVGVLEDPAFRGRVTFVPVGINYDRVLEDTRLLAEARGAASRAPTLGEKARSLLRLAVELPRAVVTRAAWLGTRAYRLALGSHGTFGIAAVQIGDPVELRDLLGADPETVVRLPEEARRAEMKRLGQALMDRIARVVPVTPVPLVCSALLRLRGDRPQARFRQEDLRSRVADVLSELRAAQAPLALGPDLDAIDAERAALADEAESRRSEMLSLEHRILDVGEAEALLDSAVHLLGRRGMVLDHGDEIEVAAEAWEVLRYYARSIAQHLARPEATAGEVEPEPAAARPPAPPPAAGP